MSKVSDVEYVAYCHATEDCSRVVEAIKNLLPPSARDTAKFKHSALRGYYGNPITIYSTRIAENAEEALNYLLERLGEIDRATLLATLDLRYDDRANKLYLRADKQEAYRGSFALRDSDDVIKIVVSFRSGPGVDIVRSYLRNEEVVK